MEVVMAHRKVLVVDDEPNIRSLVGCCLESEGFDIIESANGVEALTALQEHRPDVMILDLAMPLLDGMSVMAELRHLWDRLPTRVIVVTAHGSVKTAIEALRLGASDFIEKPFAPDELRESVQAVLSVHPEPPLILPEDQESYEQTLQAVRKALQERRFAEAERKLMKAGTITAEEPWFLNLAGIMHESLGRIESARKFYSRAVAKERRYLPAQVNLHRLGEIRRNGRSKIPVMFGGDEADAATEAPQLIEPERAPAPVKDPPSRPVHPAVRRLADWRPRKDIHA